jgi:Zn-dependent protease with chaperone function
MIFALRGLGVSLTFFLLLYSVTSFIVVQTWRIVPMLGIRLSARYRADLLLIIRTLPLIIASTITLAFVLPSFILLEPRVVSEPLGEVPLSLGACCLLLVAIGLWRGIVALRRTARNVARWLQGATPSGCYPVPLFRIQPSVPALTVAGVRTPLVLLSRGAASLLNRQELERALQHEIVHIRCRDNFKKLVFRFCPFPGMAPLEAAWSEATEMAADDGAVSNSTQALDLASALIKLSRFAAVHPPAGLASTLVQTSGSSLNARVERLISWNDQHNGKSSRYSHWYAAPAFVFALIAAVSSYGNTLNRIHQLTEWLVR